MSSEDSEGTDPFEDAPIIHRYSREDAIRDGTLVDLTEYAKEVGFVIPVACTAAVWHGCVVPEPGLQQLGQSERGRAHDLLFVLRNAIARLGYVAADRTEFEVLFLMPPRNHVPVRLVAVCGPGDGGEPVITIMMP